MHWPVYLVVCRRCAKLKKGRLKGDLVSVQIVSLRWHIT